MPYNGTGTFTPSSTLSNGTTGDATQVQAIIQDIAANGLSNAITRDGQGKPAGDIDWNGKKLTNLANGTAASDAAAYGQLTGMTTGNAFRRNLLVNGAFDVWQSGAGGAASIAGTTARIRTADCWWAIRDGATAGYTVSQQTGTVARYALKHQRDAGNASTAIMRIAQGLETADCVRLKRGSGTALYLSFYAKSGANYSGGNLTVEVVYGTGSDEAILAGYTGAAVLATLAQALTGTLTRYSLAVPANTNINELGVRFTWTPTGVAGADDSVTLECVQLEEASAPTAVEWVPFAETLGRCMRYYEKSFPYTVAPVTNGGTIFADIASWYCLTAGAVAAPVYNGFFKVPKRTHNPTGTLLTGTLYNPVSASNEVRNATDGANCSSSAATVSMHTIQIGCIQNAGGGLGDRLIVDWSASDTVF